MKLSYSLLLIIFAIGQGLAISYAKRIPDPALFALLEGSIVTLTIAGYLFTKPAQQLPATVQPPQKKPLPDPSLALRQEIAQLQEMVAHIQQEASEEQQLHDTQTKTLQEHLDQASEQTEKLAQTDALLEESAIIIRAISEDIESLSRHIEHERQQHAIEIRTLLGKNPPSAPRAHKVPLSPLSTLLVLLNQFQTMPSRSIDASLVEGQTFATRALFDLTKNFGTAPLACVSYIDPSQYIHPANTTCSASELFSAVMHEKTTLEQLRPYQPHILSSPQVGTWIVFRAHPLEIVIMTPLSPNTNSPNKT